MNELLILGIEENTFKTKEGNEAKYKVMYCLGKECNITGNRVIQYIVSNIAGENFKNNTKINEKDLAGKHLCKVSSIVTPNHKLKLLAFDVK